MGSSLILPTIVKAYYLVFFHMHINHKDILYMTLLVYFMAIPVLYQMDTKSTKQ